MALMIAPYNNAMRLGMGFNSYTQQLCVNDAVIRSNNSKAQESDLKLTGNRKAIAGTEQSASVTRTDGEVSQTVTWTSKFVDRLSEVTDSMNISGSLEIKYNAIGGKGSGGFIDTNKFKESDITFFLQVKVINQILQGEDVTEFNPIKDLAPGDFTEVFGDSYISGFITGGEFNALVSIKVDDKSKIKDIKAGLEVSLGAGAIPGLSLQAKGDVHIAESNIQTKTETTVSVTWAGGGDVKDDSIKEWSIENLRKVAVEFPDKVANYPQRTHAIITKYANLRSYQMTKNKGSPLDYQNAGVYTSALLDAYTDYKHSWTTLSNSAFEVNNNGHWIFPRESTQELKEYADEVATEYRNKVVAYINSSPSVDNTQKLLEQAGGADIPQLEQLALVIRNKGIASSSAAHVPAKPNLCRVYPPTLLGLERARREARFEMIKIVHEVDAVTRDPKVAVDLSRNHVFLPPLIFNLLVPTTGPEPVPTEQEKEIARLTEEVKAAKAEQTRLIEEAKAAALTVAEENQKRIDVLDATIKADNKRIAALEPKAARMDAIDAEEANKRAEEERRLAEEMKANADDETRRHMENQEAQTRDAQEKLRQLTERADSAAREAADTKQALTAAEERIESMTQSDQTNSAELRRMHEERDELQRSLDQLNYTHSTASQEAEEAKQNARRLENEMQSLQATTRDLQAANEELKARTGMIQALPQRVSLFGSVRLNPSLVVSVASCERWAENWRLGYIAGNMDFNNDGPGVFQGADPITRSHIPRRITVRMQSECLTRIDTEYTTGESVNFSHAFSGWEDSMGLGDGERIVWYEVQGSFKPNWGVPLVDCLALRTNWGQYKKWECMDRRTELRSVWAESAPEPAFSLRGFWGQCGAAIDRMGGVWAREL